MSAPAGIGAARCPALRPLFAPASVPLANASDDLRKQGNWLARRALTSPHELPEPAELVVIAVPARTLERGTLALDATAVFDERTLAAAETTERLARPMPAAPAPIDNERNHPVQAATERRN